MLIYQRVSEKIRSAGLHGNCLKLIEFDRKCNPGVTPNMFLE
jgi:hypothetical protein